MATGNFWDVTAPLKPVGLMDPDGVYDIPFDWASWLSGLTDTYASHSIICATGLQCTQSAGVITARIKASGALNVGSKYAVTCRITTTNGQIEDQTLLLKIIQK